MREILQNNTSDSLSASCLSTDTTISVTTGSKFPATGQFRILVESEIMLVTARSTNTLTVARGQEGTTAAAHGSGLAVTMILTQGAMQRYGRDNDPGFDSSRPPFRLLDASGNVLTSASFTQVNLSTSTIYDDSSGTITIRKPGNAGVGENITALVRSYTAPSSVIACLSGCLISGTGVPGFALVVRDSTSGKLTVMYVLQRSGAAAVVQIYHYSSPTASAGVAYGGSTGYQFRLGDRVWMKIEDDNTNHKFSISHNGEQWIQLYSEARTAYLAAPDTFGFAANNYQNAVDNLVTLLSWQG